MDARAYLPDAALQAAIERDVANYNSRLLPIRADVARRVRLYMGLYVGAVALAFVTLVAGGWAPATSLPLLIGGGVLVVFGGIWTYSAAMAPARHLQQEFRDHMIPVLFGFVDDFRYRHEVTPDSAERMPRQIVGTYNRRSFDDCISGRIHGQPFEIFEAEYRYKARNSSSTAFKGIVLSGRIATAFPGTLLAARRLGDVKRYLRDLFAGSGWSEVRSHSALDRDYEFRTDNAVAARDALGGGLTDVLAELVSNWPQGNVRMALARGDFFLLLPTGSNHFELPSIERPIDYKADLAPMVLDFARFLAIVDRMAEPSRSQA